VSADWIIPALVLAFMVLAIFNYLYAGQPK
jgi:hypothetical protein